MRTYRASALGSCTRSQVALQLGMAALGTSDAMQALYDRGNAHEGECLAAMEAEGWEVTHPAHPSDEMYAHGKVVATADQGQWYISLEVAGAVVTGHLDGVALSPMRVLEIKSPISFAKWERAHKTGDYSDPLMHRYAWQISVYMVATGLEAVVACVEDGQVRTFGIETPPFSLKDIENRVNAMETYIEKGVNLSVLKCSQADYPCPTAYLHEKPEVVEDPILASIIGHYARAKAKRDEADQSMKGLRDEADAHLGIADSITTEAGTATRVTTTRVNVDWKAAEADGVDLAKYRKTTSSTSIRVTPKETE